MLSKLKTKMKSKILPLCGRFRGSREARVFYETKERERESETESRKREGETTAFGLDLMKKNKKRGIRVISYNL